MFVQWCTVSIFWLSKSKSFKFDLVTITILRSVNYFRKVNFAPQINLNEKLIPKFKWKPDTSNYINLAKKRLHNTLFSLVLKHEASWIRFLFSQNMSANGKVLSLQKITDKFLFAKSWRLKFPVCTALWNLHVVWFFFFIILLNSKPIRVDLQKNVRKSSEKCETTRFLTTQRSIFSSKVQNWS